MNLTVNRFILRNREKSLNPAAVGCLFSRENCYIGELLTLSVEKYMKIYQKKMKFYIVDIQYIKN